MADVDPTKPQINDPELEADLIRTLSIVGPLGKLEVIQAVLPTISMGNVVQQTVDVLQPAFRSTDIFSNGFIVAAPVNTVHADTGGLAAGVYDVQAHISNSAVTDQSWEIQHRNAANTANLARFLYRTVANTGTSVYITIGYEIAVNERLRTLNTATAFAVGEISVTNLFARRRT